MASFIAEPSFGQPYGCIFQVAYIVQDLKRAMNDYANRLHIGPWFYVDEYAAAEALYRGQPTDSRFAAGLAFSGHLCFEVIQTLDDSPSVYRDIALSRGYGFHHYGVASRNFDADLKRYFAMGYETAFACRSPRGVRIAYLDSLDNSCGMLELIEFDDRQTQFFSSVHQASVGWDGADPLRLL